MGPELGIVGVGLRTLSQECTVGLADVGLLEVSCETRPGGRMIHMTKCMICVGRRGVGEERNVCLMCLLRKKIAPQNIGCESSAGRMQLSFRCSTSNFVGTLRV